MTEKDNRREYISVNEVLLFCIFNIFLVILEMIYFVIIVLISSLFLFGFICIL